MELITPVIIGANGWLGHVARQLLKQHSCYSSPIVFGSTASTIYRDGTKIYPLSLAGDILSSHSPPSQFVFLNFAYLTKDKVDRQQHGEYQRLATILNKSIADLVMNVKPLSFLFMSSGAASLVENNQAETEEMRIYGEQKLSDEIFFGDICNRNNVKFLAPRLYSIGGPFVNKVRLYALSDFILQGLETNNIVIKAQKPVYRSYCHVYDLMNVLLHEMRVQDKLPVSPTLEIGGDEVVEMADLAKNVASVLSIPPQNICRLAFDRDLPADLYLANNKNFNELATKHNIVKYGLTKTISDTVDYLRQQKKA